MSSAATGVSTATEPAGVTIGVTGQQARWSVSPWGAVIPWGPADVPTLDWYVAASDRWHVPAEEPTVRQRRLDGAPVVETRVRIPDGDAVQRVWAVPDRNGTVVVEFENESPLPFAVALTGAEVITERPASGVAIQGIDLPDDAIVMPVGHKATVRVALARSGDGRTEAVGRRWLNDVPPVLAVVSGWTRVVNQASTLALPDERLVEAVVAARCDLLLEGPVTAASDPAGFLLDVAELVRCGDSAESWLPDIVEPAERVARSGSTRRRPSSRTSESDVRARAAIRSALDAALLVAMAAGDDRASGDLGRLVARVAPDGSGTAGGRESASFADVRRGPSVGRFVRDVERRLADGGRILAGGVPKTWLGHDFEVHGLPTSGTSTVSYAVRWHGERPAVLWEQRGESTVTMTAPDLDPGWSSDAVAGEALWAAPNVDRPRRPSLDVTSFTDPGLHAGGFS